MALHLPAIVTLLALLLFLYTCTVVGLAREKYGVAAPATTGNLDFERIFRVQMNTLEHLVLFLPSLWLFSEYVSPVWAGLVGLVWLVGRLYYALSYIKDAKRRGPGFMIGFVALLVLMIGAAVGIVLRMMAGF